MCTTAIYCGLQAPLAHGKLGREEVVDEMDASDTRPKCVEACRASVQGNIAFIRVSREYAP